MTPDEILNKLKTILGGSADEPLEAAKDMEARAQAAGLATKAIDAEAGSKALEAVKALETKLGEAHILITKQAEINAKQTETIANLQGRLEGVENGQKAYQTRGETAIREVKELLVTLNTKPEVVAPAKQAELAAIEAATKDKVEAAVSGAPTPLGTLMRYTYTPDGKTVATPIL